MHIQIDAVMKSRSRDPTFEAFNQNRAIRVCWLFQICIVVVYFFFSSISNTKTNFSVFSSLFSLLSFIVYYSCSFRPQWHLYQAKYTVNIQMVNWSFPHEFSHSLAHLDLYQSGTNSTVLTSSMNNINTNDDTTPIKSQRELGIIEKLCSTYGFVYCCHRDGRYFFHFSEYKNDIHQAKIGGKHRLESSLSHDLDVFACARCGGVRNNDR